ncbi:MAG: hypothetical protein U9O55_02595 [Patescibacteria group bacterium]|nr:hypothetical protein [Patescibacteria group bacterium]
MIEIWDIYFLVKYIPTPKRKNGKKETIATMCFIYKNQNGKLISKFRFL